MFFLVKADESQMKVLFCFFLMLKIITFDEFVFSCSEANVRLGSYSIIKEQGEQCSIVENNTISIKPIFKI